MTQQVKVLAAKSAELCSISRNLLSGRRESTPRSCSLTSPSPLCYTNAVPFPHSDTYTQINVIFLKSLQYWQHIENKPSCGCAQCKDYTREKYLGAINQCAVVHVGFEGTKFNLLTLSLIGAMKWGCSGAFLLCGLGRVGYWPYSSYDLKFLFVSLALE